MGENNLFDSVLKAFYMDQKPSNSLDKSVIDSDKMPSEFLRGNLNVQTEEIYTLSQPMDINSKQIFTGDFHQNSTISSSLTETEKFVSDIDSFPPPFGKTTSRLGIILPNLSNDSDFTQFSLSEVQSPSFTDRDKVIHRYRTRNKRSSLNRSLSDLSVREIENVAVVGIHGWFPQKWLQPITGPPKGVSPKFSYHAHKAVRKYFLLNFGIVLGPGAVSPISLEFEGRVEERVQHHFQQLTGEVFIEEDFKTTNNGNLQDLKTKSDENWKPPLPEPISRPTTPTTPTLSTSKSESSLFFLPSTSPKSPPTSPKLRPFKRYSETFSDTRSHDITNEEPDCSYSRSPPSSPTFPRIVSLNRRHSKSLTHSPAEIQEPPQPPSPYFKPKDAHVYLPSIPKNEWREKIEEAELLLFVTHSQGVVVTIMLLMQLINAGVIRPEVQRVCVLAMAGVSHGLF
ncbi:hypothetical protein HK096_004149 [Nowakowskiella sp. JEL0078]|nr:hypothetical protein HK096_004149 [Nowakowskiella sp. JEL0078]